MREFYIINSSLLTEDQQRWAQWKHSTGYTYPEIASALYCDVGVVKRVLCHVPKDKPPLVYRPGWDDKVNIGGRLRRYSEKCVADRLDPDFSAAVRLAADLLERGRGDA